MVSSNCLPKDRASFVLKANTKVHNSLHLRQLAKVGHTDRAKDAEAGQAGVSAGLSRGQHVQGVRCCIQTEF